MFSFGKFDSEIDKEYCVLFNLQGIDLKAGGRNKKTKRTAPKSANVYLALLVKVRRISGLSYRTRSYADPRSSC